jgi:hypothetical protein
MAIDIDKLTVAEFKKLAKALNEGLLFEQAKASTVIAHPVNPAIGKFCVVRCRYAGVHAGLVVQANAEFVELANARRLWSWKSKFTLSEGATEGFEPANSKVGCPISVVLTASDVCELIPCTEKAKKTIEACHE